MDRASQQSPAEVPDSQEHEGRENAVETVDEVAEALAINFVAQKVETAGSQHNEQEHRDRRGYEKLVHELEGKGHEGLLEEQVAEEGNVVLDQDLDNAGQEEEVAPEVDADLVLGKAAENPVEDEEHEYRLRHQEQEEGEGAPGEVVIYIIDLNVLGIGEGSDVGGGDDGAVDGDF